MSGRFSSRSFSADGPPCALCAPWSLSPDLCSPAGPFSAKSRPGDPFERIHVADAASATIDWAELIARPEVAGFFSWMVDQSTGSLEVAAFILRDEDGTVSFLPWPRSGGFRTERWRGAIPPNVIAVAHTHPNDPVGVMASAHDRLESKRIGLPVFIVMRGRISVVDPDTGRNTILARGGGWRSGELAASRR